MTGQAESIPLIMGTKVIQVTNIAPQATRDQMQTLFGFVGKVEEIRLYPTMRDVSLPVQSRICYVKYFDQACVTVALHLTNVVFIDRAVIVTPYQAKGGEIPDEYRALDIAAQANVVPGLYPSDPKLPAHIVNQIEGIPPNQVITTQDPVLVSSGLPPYPPLPITYDSRRIEEIRRTLLVINVDDAISGEQLVEFFQRAGDVNYVRFCTRDNDSNKYALVEFSEQSSIIAGLKLNGSELAGHKIQVYHSTQAIAKPVAKSNEAAQREIEEAMTRVKEAQSMISAAIDPVIGILSKDKKRSRSSSRRRSRSRSRRRSRSRSKYRRRSRSRSRRSKRRSRSRHSSRRSRSRGRRRSPSRERRMRSRQSPRSSRRSRSKTSRHSRSKTSRRSPSKSSRRSPSKSSRRSPSKSTRRSPSKSTRRSPSKSTRRSASKSVRRSPSKSSRQSPPRSSRKSPSRRSRDRKRSRSRGHSRSYKRKSKETRSKSQSKKSRSKSVVRSRSRSNRSSRSASRRPAKEDEKRSSSEKRSQSKSSD